MNAEWLKQLAGEHAPRAIGWWPPAPGWWVLAALIVLSLLAWRMVRKTPQRMLRRNALRELRRIRASVPSAAATAGAVQNLTRRYAVGLFGVSRVARLTGEQWLAFFISHGGEALKDGTGASLLDAAYGSEVRDCRTEWLRAAEQFIRHARPDRALPAAACPGSAS